ncbi:protein RADIALIS-like 3 [Euphorbia lathyris]|uniref:protein RADIALIS-like 3 n=1 Tax=Euphorbia lathyris TaxID=212925 RepID=UPI003313F4B4
MEDCPKMLYGWSWEENKVFELALAIVDEQDPERWEIVASMVGGKKSAEDVQNHYFILLKDVQCIESGELDHTLFVGDSQAALWTDEDNKLLVQLEIAEQTSFPGKNGIEGMHINLSLA